MSRGDGRALERAAEGLRLCSGVSTDDMSRMLAQKAIDIYLNSLLGELPDHAVQAVRDYYRSTPKAAVTLDDALRAFLLSLRSSSRGGGPDG